MLMLPRYSGPSPLSHLQKHTHTLVCLSASLLTDTEVMKWSSLTSHVVESNEKSKFNKHLNFNSSANVQPLAKFPQVRSSIGRQAMAEGLPFPTPNPPLQRDALPRCRRGYRLCARAKTQPPPVSRP